MSNQVTGGVKDESTQQTLRKHFPKPFRGKAWEALLAAIADGDGYVRSLAKAAYDQVFMSSANGKYLDVHGRNEGIPRPTGVGMDDDTYRKFVISLSNKKLTVDALLEMLEVFYGAEGVRACVETEAVEPFSLVDGRDLHLLFEEQNEVVFTARNTDYHDPANATAEEVATAFTMQAQQQGSQAFAEAHTDYLTGEKYVRFYTGARGVRGSVRFVGGGLGLLLQMPGKRLAIGSIESGWTVTRVGKMAHFSTGAMEVDWRAGDTLYYAGGSFPLVKVYQGASETYVEFENEAQPEGNYGDFVHVWAPLRFTLMDGATVARSKDGFRVWMPVTTAVVKRTEKTASYLAPPKFNLTIESAYASIVDGRVQIRVNAPGHEFVEGDKVLLDGLMAGDALAEWNYWPGGTLNGLGIVIEGGDGFCLVDLGAAKVPEPDGTIPV